MEGEGKGWGGEDEEKEGTGGGEREGEGWEIDLIHFAFRTLAAVHILDPISIIFTFNTSKIL